MHTVDSLSIFLTLDSMGLLSRHISCWHADAWESDCYYYYYYY